MSTGNDLVFPAGLACERTYECPANRTAGTTNLDGDCTGHVYKCTDGEERSGTNHPYFSLMADGASAGTLSDTSKFIWEGGRGTRNSWYRPNKAIYEYCYPGTDPKRKYLCVRCRAEDADDNKAYRIVHTPAGKDTDESFKCRKFKDGEVCFEDGSWGLYDQDKEACDAAALKEDAECYDVDDDGVLVVGKVPAGVDASDSYTNPCANTKPVKSGGDDDGWPWWEWALVIGIPVLILLLLVIVLAVYMMKKK
jgi:hypothetical protein